MAANSHNLYATEVEAGFLSGEPGLRNKTQSQEANYVYKHDT